MREQKVEIRGRCTRTEGSGTGVTGYGRSVQGTYRLTVGLTRDVGCGVEVGWVRAKVVYLTGERVWFWEPPQTRGTEKVRLDSRLRWGFERFVWVLGRGEW